MSRFQTWISSIIILPHHKNITWHDTLKLSKLWWDFVTEEYPRSRTWDCLFLRWHQESQLRTKTGICEVTETITLVWTSVTSVSRSNVSSVVVSVSVRRDSLCNLCLSRMKQDKRSPFRRRLLDEQTEPRQLKKKLCTGSKIFRERKMKFATGFESQLSEWKLGFDRSVWPNSVYNGTRERSLTRSKVFSTRHSKHTVSEIDVRRVWDLPWQIEHNVWHTALYICHQRHMSPSTYVSVECWVYAWHTLVPKMGGLVSFKNGRSQTLFY
jgi:hypothetical protein